MDALSAIRSLVSPELSPLPATPATKGASAPAPIPFNEIADLGPTPLVLPTAPAGAAPVSFGSLLGDMVKDVNSKQIGAAEAVKGLISGQNVPLHQAVISMEEANVSFQLMVE